MSFFTTSRRGFVGTVAALGLLDLVPGAAAAQGQAAGDAWLDGIKGKHRMLLDVPEPDGGTALRHSRGFLDTWKEAYGVPERDVSLVVTLYGRTTPWGVADAMWEKYKLGAAIGITDSTTNAPLVRNWFAHPQHGDPVGDGTPDTSMEALQRRGVVFLLCNNALKRWSSRLEKGGLGTAADIHTDLTTHALPGVIIVPDVLIAMTKAHENGFAMVRS
jgi:hypothetical protein